MKPHGPPKTLIKVECPQCTAFTVESEGDPAQIETDPDTRGTPDA